MARSTRLHGFTSYWRKYPFAPRYPREQRLVLTAADGIRLSAARIPGPPDARCTVVLVHGFVHSSRTPAIHAFAKRLAAAADVLVPDLRGHGGSAGRCTMGRDEPLDVAAAVAAADPDRPVVTVGVSMGAAAVLLHAGTHGGVAGVVAVSAPAAWDFSGEGSARVQRYATSPFGRAVLAALLRTRIAASCEEIPHSADVVAGIAPAFLLVVHDRTDWYFGPEHAERLHDWAGAPKALWWEDGGHGTDLLTDDLAARLLRHIDAHLP